MRANIMGKMEDVIFNGDSSHTGNSPWPFLDATGSQIIINHEAVIASGVYIYTHTHQFKKKKWIFKPNITNKNPTVIGKYSFIGTYAQIMHTCKRIGDYAVVAAGSIVTRDVPDCEIWAGNPAKKIGEVDA